MSFPEVSISPELPPVEIIGRQPFRYQGKVIDWAIEKFESGQNAIPLFVEMRLGKTLMSINLLKWLQLKRNVKRTLIVCPKTVISVWERELALEGLTGLQFNTSLVRTPLVAAFKLPGIFITNYECLTRTDISDPEKYNWDCVILDETTKIRYPETHITKKVNADFQKVPYKFALTGSPDPEGLLDYFNQMKYLFGECFGIDSYWIFKDRFFYSDGPNKFKPRRGFQEMFSKYLSEIAYVLTREQCDMGSQKIYQQRYVDMEPDALKFYKEFELMWMNKEFETQWAIVAMNYAQQMSGGFPKEKEFKSNHKVEEIWDLMETDLRREKAIIWCKYTNEIEEVSRRLKFKYATDIIDGSVPLDQRKKIEENFRVQSIHSSQVLVLQIDTAGMGLDFSASDTAIYYSNPLGALPRIQSEDRIIHPNKKSPVLFFDILTNDTIDIDVYNRWLDKKENREDFLRDIFKNMKARNS